MKTFLIRDFSQISIGKDVLLVEYSSKPIYQDGSRTNQTEIVATLVCAGLMYEKILLRFNKTPKLTIEDFDKLLQKDGGVLVKDLSGFKGQISGTNQPYQLKLSCTADDIVLEQATNSITSPTSKGGATL